ncbi:MAG: hypothetical protein C4341_00760 [Armatimonadota bacterium]
MVTVSLSSWDYLVLAAMAAGILSLGFSARLRENTTLQLIAAGRNLTLPLFVATLVTTWYGGILGVGEAFDWYGVATWVLIAMPYYIFGVAYALLLASKVRAEAAISLPERFEQRFGKTTAILGALILLVLGAPGTHILMLGTLLQMLTGIGFVQAVLIGALGGTLFLYRGGLLADARSNLLAFTMMYVSFGLIFLLSVLQFGAPSLDALPESHRRWDAGQGALFVLEWVLVGSWTFVDPGFHQRVTAARAPETSRRGVLFSVGFWMLFDLLSIGTAWYAYQEMGGGLGTALFPAYADRILPAGAKGLFFAGVFGVIVSAMVGYTLVTGGTIGRDLLGRLAGTEERRVLFTRLGIALATLVGIALALGLKSVVAIWWDVANIAIPGLLVPTVAAYVPRWRLCGVAATASLLLGSGAALVWYVLQRRGVALGVDEGGVLPMYVGCAASLLPVLLEAAAARLRPRES